MRRIGFVGFLGFALSAVGSTGPGTFYVPPEGSANVTENCGPVTGSVKKTVAFLGGSITEMDGFRPRVMRQLRAKYPQVAFTEIAAGLSSTCSDAGAFRLDEDVLSKGVPDLFVVEAAVNDDQDGHFTFGHSVRGMEGCVRRVLMKNPSCAVVVGLMVNFGQYQQLTNGVTPLHYAAHAHVARHYGAALADVGSALAKSGKMTWEEYRDCHPSPTGCDFGANVVMAAIESVFDPRAKPSVRTLPPPIDELSYCNGRSVSFEKVKLGPGWQVSRPTWGKIKGHKRSYFTRGDALWTEVAGAECEFSFSGTSVAAFLTAGPDAGNLEVSVDGAPFKVLNLRAEFGELHYPYVQFIAEELKPGQHVVKLRSVAAHRKAGEGTAIRINRLYVNQ